MTETISFFTSCTAPGASISVSTNEPVEGKFELRLRGRLRTCLYLWVPRKGNEPAMLEILFNITEPRVSDPASISVSSPESLSEYVSCSGSLTVLSYVAVPTRGPLRRSTSALGVRGRLSLANRGRCGVVLPLGQIAGCGPRAAGRRFRRSGRWVGAKEPE